MITHVKIENFKRFSKAEFKVTTPLAIFVGQNNGGKTTALQAINLWSFFISRWKQKKGGGSAKRRTGTPISRAEIHPAPVQEIIDLWTNGEVREKGEISKNIPIRIILSGIDIGTKKEWEYGVEATFSNRELLHCRPIDPTKEIPSEANKIFQLPPLSGVRIQEQKADIGYQFRAVGEGRPGEILRNILLNLYQNDNKSWSRLNDASKEFFGIELLPISYNPDSDPFISVFYRTTPASSDDNRKLEIANVGSGFLQFLLVAGFLLAHPSSILLLDEPDSHMHVFLQRTMFDWLQKSAIEHKSQLIISTHSEVLIDSSKAEEIVAFFKSTPKNTSPNNNNIRNALNEVSPLAIVHAEWKKRLIFLEGDTDRKILSAWAEKLKHNVKSKLDGAFFQYLETNNIGKAKQYTKSLQSLVDSDVKTLCLRDNNVKKSEGLFKGFECLYWDLPEIENYLICPKTLINFSSEISFGGLFGIKKAEEAENYLRKVLPPAYYDDPCNQTALLKRKGSEFLEIFFKNIKENVGKSEYWKIALMMDTNLIFPEVIEKLDIIDNFLS